MLDHSFEENVCTFNKSEVILGVDEAGRGPVLGPMVYACLYYPKENEEVLKEFGADDSKKLTSSNRDKINVKIRKEIDKFGWRIHSLSPEYLSCEMQKRKKHNLNEISHTATIDLISSVLNNGVNVKEIYIDTVGPPEAYKNKLKRIFPNISIVVKPKADSLFTSVSGASILAKVKRDDFLLNWWDQPDVDKYDLNGNDISKYEQGSGYPGDPKTKEFLKLTFDPIFGFPNIVRFSWSTAVDLINKDGYDVIWDLKDSEENNQGKISFSNPKKKDNSSQLVQKFVPQKKDLERVVHINSFVLVLFSLYNLKIRFNNLGAIHTTKLQTIQNLKGVK
ncbi:ribonuclease HI large subunit [Cryptosporidium ryanae]|uniref:ribonuclease HI large subunit n=1 Tax=Cryptosporidium ryanae TaxID=515981 RepID=UPI00351A1645|nr:ribonuclease HI large subunit [Cryptosporidium ryanae]